MPGAAYPDGANLAIPEAVRAALRAAGLTTPVIAVGKLGTLELAEKVVARGRAISSAWRARSSPTPTSEEVGARPGGARRSLHLRQRLQDARRELQTCRLHALAEEARPGPESDDTTPPVWPTTGADLTAEHKEGRVVLRWKAATDDGGMYGYQVFRGEELGGAGALLTHHASVRALSARYEDTRVVAGATYRYAVKPYDLAGNRGPMSAAAQVRIPNEIASPPRAGARH